MTLLGSIAVAILVLWFVLFIWIVNSKICDGWHVLHDYEYEYQGEVSSYPRHDVVEGHVVVDVYDQYNKVCQRCGTHRAFGVSHEHKRVEQYEPDNVMRVDDGE